MLQCALCFIVYKGNKNISYRRETALRGGLVMAKSGRLELRDNIYKQYRSIQPLRRIWPAKKSKSAKKRKIRAVTPFKVIQGHPRSSRSVPIESPYATSY